LVYHIWAIFMLHLIFGFLFVCLFEWSFMSLQQLYRPLQPITAAGRVRALLYTLAKKGALDFYVIKCTSYLPKQGRWYNCFAKRMEHLFPNLHSIIPCIINNDNMKRNLPTIMRQSVVSPKAKKLFCT
jgi:hypothetical protein